MCWFAIQDFIISFVVKEIFCFNVLYAILLLTEEHSRKLDYVEIITNM